MLSWAHTMIVLSKFYTICAMQLPMENLKMGAIDGDISTIEFKDRNKRTKQLFIIRLDIDLLREFVEDFAYNY